LPAADPALRKTSTQFAADAARRFPYKADAPTAVEAQARYRAPARFYDLLNVHVRTAALGRTSFVVEFLVTRGGAEETIAEVRSAHVIVDLETRRPIPLPEFFRRAILQFEGPNIRTKD
jgi:acyl-CoA thioester hydrolase